MATTFSRNLRLRIDSNLTANSKYNLARLDELGGIYQLDSTGQVAIRSNANIVIEPEAPSVGGAGVGGVVSIGTAGHSLTEIALYAAEVTLSGSLVVDSISLGTIGAGIVVSDADSVLTAIASLPISLGGTGAVTAAAARNNLLPAQSGNTGKVLGTDGSSVSWVSPGAGAAVIAGYDWTATTSKVIAHGLSDTDMSIIVYDSLGDMVFPDVNIDATNITLTSSEAPSGTWRVVVVGT